MVDLNVRGFELFERASGQVRRHARAEHMKLALRWFEVAKRRAASVESQAVDVLLDVARELRAIDPNDLASLHRVAEAQLQALAFADSHGPGDPFLRAMLGDSASVLLRRLGRLSESAIVVEVAATVALEHAEQWGVPARAVVRTAVGALTELALFERALPFAEWLVTQERATFSPSTVISLYQFAMCCRALGRFDEAESSIVEAIAIRDARRPAGTDRKLDVVTNELESWLALMRGELGVCPR